MFVLNLFKRNTLVTASVCSIFLIFLGFTDKTYATESCKSSVAEIVSVKGVIELRRANETVWRAAVKDTMLCSGDMIHARSHSNASLRLSNESMLRLDQRTTITFPQSEQDEATSLLDLLRGAIHIITRTPRPFKVRTPFVNALVDGTEFFVGVDEDSTTLILYEGQITARNDHGSLVLVDHEAAIADKNQAPRKEIIMRPIDAVQWALYYPAIIDYHRNGGRHSGPQSDDEISRLLREAADLLTVGRVDEASVVIDQAQTFEPDNSEAIALQAIISVVQNDKEQALNLATQAVALDPVSSAAKLALSYALQAHFKIEDALEIVQEAVTLDSDNALLWARLAELQMSVGDLDRALNAAQQAVDLSPNLAKTQTVLGFAYLLRIETQGAKTMFTKAILLDQSDPMPRLGMGLALIREGALEAGRIELEIAASLDPANSLIRSYLGKAYFEEKRYPQATTQFELAKKRDPYDPTPWFYDAIQKQTQNRPVEALKDIQKSIELNDNRAVYRSRLLLDQDQAGRGSSLARIFQNLGFEKRALVETAKSLSFDPSNHSAHRFLSDVYINIPRHEIARVSELLQAQLLQPINVNPVQPQLAVADLNIITNTGPASPGFNEFTPLVERNRSQLVASGFGGSNSTFGNEIVFSKLYEKTSVSLGQFHYQSNGFRENNDQNHDILNAFIQHAVTPKLNVQAEVRTRESEHGRLLLDFGRNNEGNSGFDEDFQRRIKEDTARIGARYKLSSNQDLLVSAKYIDRTEKTPDNILSTPGFQVEAQHLFRKRTFNSIFGGSFYQFRWKKSANSSFDEFNRENAYIYTNIDLPRNLNTTLAVSYDSFTSTIDGSRADKINPKFGLQWNINNDVRLRFAWFKATKSHLVAQQSLEPTQVAGFNQFFDDFNGTRSRRMGIGLDARFPSNLYSGIEASERLLYVPKIGSVETMINSRSSINPAGEILQKQEEKTLRAYLYWMPHIHWAIRSELIFEKFSQWDNDDINQVRKGDPVQIKNLSVPLSVEYFHPSGFFSKFDTTFVRQDLKRRDDFSIRNGITARKPRDPETSYSGIDSFFLLDWSVGFRLPNRRGILSFEGRNLLDSNFYYRSMNLGQSEATTARFIPTRTFFARVTLSF